MSKTIEYETNCCHSECLVAYIAEIERVGFKAAEDICVIAEREDDARCFALEALAEDYFRS
jgi:hypothetical protein